ncbi:MAG TPA: hypothetical protein VLC95_10045, partial [Anaerolineae bacterium]|nr:hypothetical protein [Anaerolineae bacterium]
MENREPKEAVPEEEPQVYTVKKDLSGWQFNRRHFLAAAGAGAAAAAAGALAGCGTEPEPVVIQVTATPSPVPLPTSTLASPVGGDTPPPT